MFKPENYNSLSPYFVVEGAAKLVNLLDEIFEVEELRIYEDENGEILHGEFRIEDSVIMLANSNADYPANKMLVHVYVLDVDATFKKAIDAGCESLQLPTESEADTDRRGMFKDFAGNTWAVATQLRAE